MARSRNSVPSYLLHKATGQAYVRIAGQNRYLGKHGSAESQERYAALIAELATKPPTVALEVRVISIIDRQSFAVIDGRFETCLGHQIPVASSLLR